VAVTAELKARLDTLEKTMGVAAKKCMELVTVLHADMLRLVKDLDERLKLYLAAQVAWGFWFGVFV
jgi:hypothetical protein